MEQNEDWLLAMQLRPDTGAEGNTWHREVAGEREVTERAAGEGLE